MRQPQILMFIRSRMLGSTEGRSGRARTSNNWTKWKRSSKYLPCAFNMWDAPRASRLFLGDPKEAGLITVFSTAEGMEPTELRCREVTQV